MRKHTNYNQLSNQIEYEINNDGCFVPINRALNPDGYLRVKNIDEDRMVMMHRLSWENEIGEIPDGYEIDHKCRNRCCFNTNHLQCIDGKTHAIKSNKERYADRINKVKWLIDLGLHSSEISKELNISKGTVEGYVSKHCTERTHRLKKRKMLGERDSKMYYGKMRR